MEYASTWVNIDLDAISENYDAIAKKSGAKVCAVVKADAYGHGAVQVAKVLQDKCAFFGVSSVAEALELRRANIQKPILILGHTPPELFNVAVEQSLRIALFDLQEANALSRAAQKAGKPALVHIAVDTGMSRIGLQADQQGVQTCLQIAKLPGLQLEGLFSHFATADAPDGCGMQQQNALFARFDENLRENGLCIGLRHVDNSAAVVRCGCHYEMVRAGIALYGQSPVDDPELPCLPLRPAMQWETAVSYVKTLPAGRAISYGGTYVTDRPTVVATVPVGYADGYRRSLSNRFYVLIRGVQAPIVGRVCMDQMMVDVTDIPGVQVGDRVVLMGTDGDKCITASQLAEAADSFHYEQLCDVSRRVTRVYYRGGKCVESCNYLIDE